MVYSTRVLKDKCFLLHYKCPPPPLFYFCKVGGRREDGGGMSEKYIYVVWFGRGWGELTQSILVGVTEFHIIILA